MKKTTKSCSFLPIHKELSTAKRQNIALKILYLRRNWQWQILKWLRSCWNSITSQTLNRRIEFSVKNVGDDGAVCLVFTLEHSLVCSSISGFVGGSARHFQGPTSTSGWTRRRGRSTKARILCFKFSLNPLRFSLTRKTNTKIRKAKRWAIVHTK